MRKVFAQILLLLSCGNFVFSQTPAIALKLLKQKYPAVIWNAKSQVNGDFDYDGVTDYALRGRKGAKLVVGIVKGSINDKSKHRTLEFGEDAGLQDALCSVKTAVITTDEIDKDYINFAADYLETGYAARTFKNLPKGSKGITVADGMCDSFHIYWDKMLNDSRGGAFDL